MSSDPVAYGIVTSLSRPEANITGVVVDAGAELWGKRLRDGGRSSDIEGLSGDPKGVVRERIVRGAVEAAARQVGLSLSGPAIESPTQEPEYRRAFGDAVAFGSNAAIVSTSPENELAGESETRQGDWPRCAAGARRPRG